MMPAHRPQVPDLQPQVWALAHADDVINLGGGSRAAGHATNRPDFHEAVSQSGPCFVVAALPSTRPCLVVGALALMLVAVRRMMARWHEEGGTSGHGGLSGRFLGCLRNQ